MRLGVTLTTAFTNLSMLCKVNSVYHRFLVHGKRVSAIAAISTEGLVGIDLTAGTVNTSKFVDFVIGTIFPEMESFYGPPKKSIEVLCYSGQLVHPPYSGCETGFWRCRYLVIFMPPYSPNLFEEAFSSIKYYLKNHDEVMQAVDDPALPLRIGSLGLSQCLPFQSGWKGKNTLQEKI